MIALLISIQAVIMWWFCLVWLPLHCAERNTKNPAVNNLQTSNFDNFTELLFVISTDFYYLDITTDFNIHSDNPKDKTAKEFCGLLETFDLLRHVKGHTHNQGQTLDLVISNGVDVSCTVVRDVGLSDHFCVSSDMLISPDTQTRSVSGKNKKVHKWEH